MDRLTLAFIDHYRALRVAAGKAPKTVYTETVVIRQLVNFALSRHLVDQYPLRGLKLKKPKPTRQPCWTLEEVQSILAAAPGHVRPALALLSDTEFRFGELACLTWQDVNHNANVIMVRPKEGWKPKTGDFRNIPISQVSHSTLKALPKTWRWVTTMPPSTTHVPDQASQEAMQRLEAANSLQLQQAKTSTKPAQRKGDLK